MRVHCVLEKEKYSTEVYHSDTELKTVVKVAINDEELYDGFTVIEDIIVVLSEGGDDE